MSSLAPPISIHFTQKQLAWLDRRRRLGTLTRSAALRQAIDALIQQEEGSPAPVGAMAQGSPLGGSGPLQLELTPESELPAQPEASASAPESTTPAGEG